MNMEETSMASDPYNEKFPYGEKKFPTSKGSGSKGNIHGHENPGTFIMTALRKEI